MNVSLKLDGFSLEESLAITERVQKEVAINRALNDLQSDNARRAYEEHVIKDAKAIVGGKLSWKPTVEHLRVLLDRLAVYEGHDISEQPF